MNYDIIGDLHGHADALRALLAGMGYSNSGGVWRHPERQAIFVGDFIDRGPSQVETVTTVRRMVEAGAAQAVMGNHEFNAIAWYLPDPRRPGDYLRPHHSPKYGDKNFKQHQAFLNEVNGTALHGEIIDWFLTLPLWLDLGAIRVVHGCWHPRFMDYLRPLLAPGNKLSRDLMLAATTEPDNEADKDTPEPSVFKAVEALTKGIEIPLPPPHSFTDKDGHVRQRVRVRWWDAAATSYRQAVLLDDGQSSQLPDTPVPAHVLPGITGSTPVFVGHYWQTGVPTVLSERVACVDYSVAKGGKLVAYRWDGEAALCSSRLYWVGK